MKRGEIYRVRRPTGDPKPARSFVIVSRQALVDSNYSTLICAPVFSERLGLSTQVPIGPDEGLKHDSAINCDALVSIDKARLTDFVGSLSVEKLALLEAALAAALSLPA
ncbi:MAG TPA: type II toxin-antitoxin system PemK/MazF family toxin [Caulobacterales bacterium]|nr:type II toxin-antitoxin system PemK/MazF family toxin [Caulobacterales bacterium]